MYPMNNYNYYPQAQTPSTGYNTPQYPRTPQNIPMGPGLKGHPVSSLEEVRAVTVDFDGSVFFFPDLANRRIYTKQINLDGMPLYKMYELSEIPQNSGMVSNSYVTREEFEEVIKGLQANFLAAMQQPVQKEELKNF